MSSKNLLDKFSTELWLVGIFILFVLSVLATAQAVGVFTRLALVGWFMYVFYQSPYWGRLIHLIEGGDDGTSRRADDAKVEDSAGGSDAKAEDSRPG